MRTHASAQLIGDRSHQCDATATATGPNGARAYALLDGIGSTDEVRDWTRQAARRLARTAAYHADAETGLRAQYGRYAADPDRQGPWARQPDACAVVAVTSPRWLTVAWCGDTRAYLLVGGRLIRLTQDHNLRRVLPPNEDHGGGNRNIVTSYLGSVETDQEVKGRYGHAAIETTTRQLENSRLLLASDGAYEPLEDAGLDLSGYLVGDVAETARAFVDTAVATARAVADPYADNATVLIADLRA
ncbi:PP2C family protein-serine/threonine phosphatase [Streptomyces dubilierae]|uniref:Mucin-2 n=1 Tax=Streptomyces dubilierae TaxID=3075533 RepID=A0ABU2P954_9ACTN|nr:mucin-2 [Streptomyces sp. DSM 41921]MDT0387830.1 mucin-2 [Streptomyces sp. DSM 41921]